MSSNLAALRAIRTAAWWALAGEDARAAAVLDSLLECYPVTGDTAQTVEFLLGGDSYDAIGTALEALNSELDPSHYEEDGLTRLEYIAEVLTEARQLLAD